MNFNPRSREGNDGIFYGLWVLQNDFNPRSREGNDLDNILKTKDLDDFNPRSREGNDALIVQNLCRLRHISIHAPAKGTTYNNSRRGQRERFQSTLPRRERLPLALQSFKDSLFQSTLPRRERLSASYDSCIVSQDFNPRSREGNDRATQL